MPVRQREEIQELLREVLDKYRQEDAALEKCGVKRLKSAEWSNIPETIRPVI